MYLILLSGESDCSLCTQNETIGKDYSLLQRVWKQIQTAGLTQKTVILADSEQSNAIVGLLGPVNIVVEPERRGSFASVALACSFLKSKLHAKDDDAVCVLPSALFTQDSFFETLKLLPSALHQSGAQIALIGAHAAAATGKYGFILEGRKEKDYYIASAFHRSPDFSSINEDGALWSCGVHCMYLGDILAKLPANVPANYNSLSAEFSKIPNTCFEREFLGDPADLAVVPFEGLWKSPESWKKGSDSVNSNSQETGFQQIVMDTAAVLGSSNINAAAPNDIDDKLHEEVPDRKEHDENSWGSVAVLDDTNTENGRILIRKVHVRNGQQISSRYEADFNQTWSVIKGSAELTLGWELKFLQFGDSIQIPCNVWYSLRADEDLWMIQVLTHRTDIYQVQNDTIAARSL